MLYLIWDSGQKNIYQFFSSFPVELFFKKIFSIARFKLSEFSHTFFFNTYMWNVNSECIMYEHVKLNDGGYNYLWIKKKLLKSLDYLSFSQSHFIWIALDLHACIIHHSYIE